MKKYIPQDRTRISLLGKKSQAGRVGCLEESKQQRRNYFKDNIREETLKLRQEIVGTLNSSDNPKYNFGQRTKQFRDLTWFPHSVAWGLYTSGKC